jgi:hypothetical protein
MSEIIAFPASNRRAFLTRALAGAVGATITARTGNATPPADDDRWRSIGAVAASIVASDPVPGLVGQVDDVSDDAAYGKLCNIEDQMEALVPISAAGALELVRFLRYRNQVFEWSERDDQIADNLIAGLDALCGDSNAVAGSNAADEARDMAAIEFEPVDNTAMIADFSEPTWSEMMGETGVDLRLAAMTLGKTKPELVALARDLLQASDGGDGLFDLMGRLADTQKRLKMFGELVFDAFCRLQVAASAVAFVDEPGGDAP